jgi:pyridoxamine 5'-phosphate oxidase
VNPSEQGTTTGRPEWTLYTLRADQVEFWPGDKERKHTRLQYLRAGGTWSRRILWP